MKQWNLMKRITTQSGWMLLLLSYSNWMVTRHLQTLEGMQASLRNTPRSQHTLFLMLSIMADTRHTSLQEDTSLKYQLTAFTLVLSHIELSVLQFCWRAQCNANLCSRCWECLSQGKYQGKGLYHWRKRFWRLRSLCFNYLQSFIRITILWSALA